MCRLSAGISLGRYGLENVVFSEGAVTVDPDALLEEMSAALGRAATDLVVVRAQLRSVLGELETCRNRCEALSTQVEDLGGYLSVVDPQVSADTEAQW